MRSLGTRLHQDCNTIWQCENLSLRSFYFKLEEHRKVRRYDTTWPWGSAYLRGSTKSRKEQVKPKVRKDRVCIFVVWEDEMKMRCCLYTQGSAEYLLRVAHSTSIALLSQYTHRRFLMIYLEPVIELSWWCTWSPRLSELRDAVWGRDRASLEMQLEIELEWTQRCTGWPWSTEFGDALGGRDRVNCDMHLEAVIDRVWRCTGRPWSSEFGDVPGGQDRVNWEMHLETVIDRVWKCTGRPQSS